MSMNFNYIINLLRKNVIFILIFFIIFFYYFYNSYTEIMEKHPKYKISSSWSSNYSSLFEDLNLIASSMSLNYKNFISNLNKIIMNYEEEDLPFSDLDRMNLIDQLDDMSISDLNNTKIKTEILTILFDETKRNDGLVDMQNFQDYKSFILFSNENIEFFYHQQLLRNIHFEKKYNITPKIFNDKNVDSNKPFNVKINLSTLTNDDYLNNFKEIDDLMSKSNNSFKQQKLESVMVFFDWLKTEFENSIEVIENYYDLNEETKVILNNSKSFALEKLNSQRKKVELIFNDVDFKLFIKLSENSIKLNDQINQKIWLNLFGYLLAYILLISFFMFCREIISEYMKRKHKS